MNKAVFNMDPFNCPSCIKKIESTLNKIDGVESAQVLFNSGRIRVNFDNDKTSADHLSDTITKLGYTVRSRKVT